MFLFNCGCWIALLLVSVVAMSCVWFCLVVGVSTWDSAVVGCSFGRCGWHFCVFAG